MSYPYTAASNLFNLLHRFVDPANPPPEVDYNLYRLLHEDLAYASDNEILEHFRTTGKAEGRVASAAAHRNGFLQLLKGDLPTLEIGPFIKPALRGGNVSYFDVLDREGLIRRSQEIGFVGTEPVDINFVEPTGNLSIVPSESFDRVFSSHCIEHQPDLVCHLQHVARILRPFGRYYLIIPDKRYCFDHFLDVSELPAVLEAHDERRTAHSVRSVYEHYALTTHSDPIGHWSNWHDDPNINDRAQRAENAIMTFDQAKGKYIDVHAWQFTPDSFRVLLFELTRLGLIELQIERTYDTVWSQYEFTAILTKIENSNAFRLGYSDPSETSDD